MKPLFIQLQELLFREDQLKKAIEQLRLLQRQELQQFKLALEDRHHALSQLQAQARLHAQSFHSFYRIPYSTLISQPPSRTLNKSIPSKSSTLQISTQMAGFRPASVQAARNFPDQFKLRISYGPITRLVGPCKTMVQSQRQKVLSYLRGGLIRVSPQCSFKISINLGDKKDYALFEHLQTALMNIEIVVQTVVLAVFQIDLVDFAYAAREQDVWTTSVNLLDSLDQRLLGQVQLILKNKEVPKAKGLLQKVQVQDRRSLSKQKQRGVSNEQGRKIERILRVKQQLGLPPSEPTLDILRRIQILQTQAHNKKSKEDQVALSLASCPVLEQIHLQPGQSKAIQFQYQNTSAEQQMRIVIVQGSPRVCFLLALEGQRLQEQTPFTLRKNQTLTATFKVFPSFQAKTQSTFFIRLVTQSGVVVVEQTYRLNKIDLHLSLTQHCYSQRGRESVVRVEGLGQRRVKQVRGWGDGLSFRLQQEDLLLKVADKHSIVFLYKDKALNQLLLAIKFIQHFVSPLFLSYAPGTTQTIKLALNQAISSQTAFISSMPAFLSVPNSKIDFQSSQGHFQAVLEGYPEQNKISCLLGVFNGERQIRMWKLQVSVAKIRPVAKLMLKLKKQQKGSIFYKYKNLQNRLRKLRFSSSLPQVLEVEPRQFELRALATVQLQMFGGGVERSEEVWIKVEEERTQFISVKVQVEQD